MACQIRKYIIPTIRLLTILNEYPKNVCLDQYCGHTEQAISYLLSFKHISDEPKSFNPLRAYTIYLIGRSKFGTETLPDHIFTILNENGRWLMIDSYVNCRGFRCREINLKDVWEKINFLAVKFDPDIWYEIADCPATYVPGLFPVKINIDLHEYTYSLKKMENRFVNLEKLVS